MNTQLHIGDFNPDEDMLVVLKPVVIPHYGINGSSPVQVVEAATRLKAILEEAKGLLCRDLVPHPRDFPSKDQYDMALLVWRDYVGAVGYVYGGIVSLQEGAFEQHQARVRRN